jgi:class 3 adenylate cyclase
VRNKNLSAEKKHIEAIAEHSHLLLCRILPEQVVEQMHAGRKIIADHFRSVTIVFTDLKGFTKYSSTMTPSALLEVRVRFFCLLRLFFVCSSVFCLLIFSLVAQ